jgi:hypothetical protein
MEGMVVLAIKPTMPTRFKFRQHPLYRISLWILLALSLGLLWQMNAKILSNPKYIPVDDYSHYWAAGRLNIFGNNPYSPVEIQALRDQITQKKTVYDTIPIMWAPPWSLPVLMPLGLLDYPASRLIWLIAHVIMILACANVCWKLYAGHPGRIFIAWITAFILGPTISVMEKGQITPWILVGIVGFLYFHEQRKQPFIAGLWMVLIALKPQLLYLFWPAMLLWILHTRAWKFLIGGAAGFLSALLVSLAFNPELIHQYYLALTTYPPTDWATPTLGGYLRLLFGIDQFWLQFIPPIFGLVWLGIFWQKSKQNWRWQQQIPALLWVSILTTPYAWTYDQVILLPAILLAVAQIHQKIPRKFSFLLWAGYGGINFLDLILHRYYDEFWFGWLAPALLLWYIAALRIGSYYEEKTDLLEPQNP